MSFLDYCILFNATKIKKVGVVFLPKIIVLSNTVSTGAFTGHVRCYIVTDCGSCASSVVIDWSLTVPQRDKISQTNIFL